MTTDTVLERLRECCPTLSVGVLTADLMNLESEIRTIEEAGVRLLHVDVMDGCFCPMMTVGPPFIKGLKTSLLKDVHLMIEEPEAKVAEYVAAGADFITVHLESSRHIHRVFQQLGTMRHATDPDRGIIRGAALNPGTPLTALEPVLDLVEMVVLLAVNPGWSGQKFIEGTTRRVNHLRRMIAESGVTRHPLVAVDGGITRDNAGRISDLGAEIIVTGSAVFDGKSSAENARSMLRSIRPS